MDRSTSHIFFLNASQGLIWISTTDWVQHHDPDKLNVFNWEVCNYPSCSAGFLIKCYLFFKLFLNVCWFLHSGICCKCFFVCFNKWFKLHCIAWYSHLTKYEWGNTRKLTFYSKVLKKHSFELNISGSCVLDKRLLYGNTYTTLSRNKNYGKLSSALENTNAWSGNTNCMLGKGCILVSSWVFTLLAYWLENSLCKSRRSSFKNIKTFLYSCQTKCYLHHMRTRCFWLWCSTVFLINLI